MSELHYDADGEPAKVPADAEELRVRRFRKPGERGACEVVHGADGAPLYVPVDTTYLEFRKVVDGVPGRYRLDPVDAGRRVVSSATPLYVTIDPQRNATAGNGDDRDSIVRELIRANTELVKANIEMTKQVTERLSYIMGGTGDMVRAASGAGLPDRTPPPLPSTPDADGEGDEEGDQGDDEADAEPSHPLVSVIEMLAEKFQPEIEAWLASRYAGKKDTQPGPTVVPPPAAVPAAATASVSAPSVPAAASNAASAAAPVAPPAPSVAPPEPSPTVAAPGAAVVASPPTAPASTASPPASFDLRNAMALLTPAQTRHLVLIKSRLTEIERAVLMATLPRLTPTDLLPLVQELCALPVDDATALLRSRMPPLKDPTRKEKTP